MTRPIIPVSVYVERAQHGVWNETCALLPFAYVEAIQRAGASALLVPPDPYLAADPTPLLERVDALLLAGGADVDPASYGAAPDPETAGSDPARDALEIALARGACERDLPLLGVCRGLQILNVARGGTLIQHVPAVAGGSAEHRRNLGSFVDNGHDVELEPGSLAAQAAGSVHHATISHHHQAVGRLGAGLRVTGRAADGIIEAAEDPTLGYVLGVQWHPEVDATSPVIASLVSAAQERLASLTQR